MACDRQNKCSPDKYHSGIDVKYFSQHFVLIMNYEMCEYRSSFDRVRRPILSRQHRTRQASDERSEQGFAASACVVHELEEAEVNLRIAGAVFMTEDGGAARMLAAEKEAFRDLESQATASHFAGLRQGRATDAGNSSLYLDVLRDLKRVNTHLVAAAAYPVLEAGCALLPSRLRQDPDAP